MGNTEPSNSKLKVHIDKEHEFYNSGSTINGTVFVDAHDNFQFDALYIRIQGDQYCQWFEGSSKNRRKFTGNQNFYVQEEMLQRFERGLTTGKYMYPFSIQISENIPGTYLSTEYDANISYRLVAYFANFNDKKKRHYYHVPLIIREPFRQEISEYEGKSTTSPVTFCCCNQGETTLLARFKTNVCFEGDTIPMQIECDNTMGKKAVNKFVTQLVQYTFISANNGVSRTYRKVIDRQYCRTKVNAGDRVDDINTQFIVKPSKKLQQTAISTLVANYFRLEVYADLASISKDEPCIYSPLFVMKKQYKYKGQTKKPFPINEADFNNRAKHQHFPAPEYWFRKNKNLSVMNFRLQDNIPMHQTQHHMNY